jgi:hypothetical protein
MHSVEESPLQSRNSVGGETDTVLKREEQAEEIDSQKQKKKGSQVDYIQANKARYEAAIPSEPKPTLHQEEKEQAQERD